MRSEYIAKNLMGQQWYTEFALGRTVTPTEALKYTEMQLRALDVRKLRADLVVLYADRLDIYEFQLLPRYSKFGQLLVYKEIARDTPSLAFFHDMPINGILVAAVQDDFLEALCMKHGLQYRVYTPEWLPLYFETLRPRDYTPISVQAPGA